MDKENKPYRDVTLSYIDKAHTSLHLIGKKLNRTSLTLFIVCLVTLGVNYGLLNISSSFSFLGFTFQIESSLIIIGLCIWCYFLQVYFYGLSVKESENSDLIVNLYKKLGFYDGSLNSEDACVLEYPSILSIAFSKLMKKKLTVVDVLSDFGSIISSIMILIIATVTISIVSFGIIKIQCLCAWESITMIILLVLSLINLIIGFKKGFSL
ncbi:hypothetical protein HNV12_13895 [Methanococcoides sp. SA1]|nr:hypothetical protein [Methanococcoides sp. SA1]